MRSGVTILGYDSISPINSDISIFPHISRILLIKPCLCLRMSYDERSLSGAYFTNVGKYNYIDTKDGPFVTSYTLTELENVLVNALNLQGYFRVFRRKLGSNLTEIFEKAEELEPVRDREEND